MAKKIRTNLGIDSRNRNRARRVNEAVPTDAEISLICAKCNSAGKYMLIDKGVEHWLCMQHYFSY